MNDYQVLPYCVQVYWEEVWCMSWSECCVCAMAFYAACQWHMMVFSFTWSIELALIQLRGVDLRPQKSFIDFHAEAVLRS